MLSAFFILASVLLMQAASALGPGFFEAYTPICLGIFRMLNSAFSFCRYSLWELLLAAVVLVYLYYLIRCIRTRCGFLKWLSAALAMFCLCIFVFTSFWGVCHTDARLSEKLGLDCGLYTRQQLFDAVVYYALEANSTAGAVPRDADGTAAAADPYSYNDAIARAYGVLAEQYPIYGGYTGVVKCLSSSRLFSYMGTTGIFVCFTGEPCINTDTYKVWVPFTMCHEIAHSKGIANEADANYSAYLACMASEDPVLRYSGAFGAYVYCINALNRVDPVLASLAASFTSDQVRADSRANSLHYDQFEGGVQDASQSLNDMYLKVYTESDGVQSYGAVADLLIFHYLKQSD